MFRKLIIFIVIFTHLPMGDALSQEIGGDTLRGKIYRSYFLSGVKAIEHMDYGYEKGLKSHGLEILILRGDSLVVVELSLRNLDSLKLKQDTQLIDRAIYDSNSRMIALEGYDGRRNLYSYNARNKLSSTTVYQDSIFVSSETFDYVYDKKDSVITIIRDNQHGKIDTIMKSNFGQSGFLHERIYSGLPGHIVEKVFFDTLGRQTRKESYYRGSLGWLAETQYSIEDTESYTQEYRFASNDITQPIFVRSIVKKRDNMNHLIERISFGHSPSLDDNRRWSTTREWWKYDEQNHEIENGSDDGRKVYRHIIEYNDKGFISKETSYQNNTMLGFTEHKYIY
jgi:hypothetical protein